MRVSAATFRSLPLEASRGTDPVCFAENPPTPLTAIRGNLAKLKIGGGYSIEDRSVAHLLRALIKAQRLLDIVFLDPPYEAAEEYSGTLSLLAREHAAILAPEAIVVVEHQKKAPLAEK